MSNDNELIRIGRGVPTPAYTRPRRRTALLVLGAGLFLGAGITGALFAGQIFGTSQAGPPPIPMPAASSPGLKILDEQATCVLVVPVAKDGAEQVLAVTRNPDTVNWAKVQKTYDDLRLISEIAAPELRDDINQQAALLSQLLSLSRTGGKLTVDFTDFKASGLRIGARCDRYAS